MNQIPKRYESASIEPKWQQYWEENGTYRFQPDDNRPVYSVDTPPPTVSGDLHLGHCYSYSHPDFYIRFERMNGKNIFYPMGWDDNGLPTERLVEERMGISPEKVGAEAFIKAITETSQQLEQNYEKLWRRIGLSVDWRYTYSTISASARKVAQYSFIDLYKQGRVYRASSPTIWCPSCKTALAQAEITDLERETNFITIAFTLSDGQVLPISTTRPELLPACVAVFVNPNDKRHNHLIGKKAITPVLKKEVPILGDPKADPEKGTGIVMCCTFGDTTDIKWWREHNLPLISVIDRSGRLNEAGGFLVGMSIKQARKRIIEELTANNQVLDKKVTSQTVSIHDRCDTPIEYLETKQWFIKILDQKERLLEAGRQINWHPAHMHARYEDWVKNLEWDWCISRQRYYGVPFPLWYCVKCEAVQLAEVSELPVDPRSSKPTKPCSCGGTEFVPETSVLDTWGTSSMSPQVAARWLDEPNLFKKVFPMSIRPQAHDIIRTWAFYTIVKALYHENKVPWSDIAISGHGLSPEGHKVNKSRGHTSDPNIMMSKYSADAVRYWAASSKLGEDSMISEDKIASGQKLVNKLWNVTSFSYQFLEGYTPPIAPPVLLPTDKWALSKLNRLIPEVTKDFAEYNHASAKNRTEEFFWDVFTDNYMEMVKTRLYDCPEGSTERNSAKYTLYKVLLTLLKIIAPIMPFVTEEIYQLVFKKDGDVNSVHIVAWPKSNDKFISTDAEAIGDMLIEIATAVRRYKSEKKIPMGSPLEKVKIAVLKKEYADVLNECLVDIKSVTRAKQIEINVAKIDSAVAVEEIS
ncbi:MAG: valine--tRNA ligase [Dehalococcoidales bacterium]